jgi:hypothetical protein
MGRRCKYVVIPLFLLGFFATAAHAETRAPCIRATDPGIRALIARGLAGSPTFRRLYERLKESDLIVHLERGAQPWLSTGFNQFVTGVGERRFVRITLNVAQADDDAVALLGHELQHAVELAVEPDVDDLEGYEQLYRRIGYRSCSREPRCFDTVAAVAAGRLILTELRLNAPRLQALAPVSSLARAGGRDGEPR